MPSFLSRQYMYPPVLYVTHTHTIRTHTPYIHTSYTHTTHTSYTHTHTHLLHTNLGSYTHTSYPTHTHTHPTHTSYTHTHPPIDCCISSLLYSHSQLYIGLTIGIILIFEPFMRSCLGRLTCHRSTVHSLLTLDLSMTSSDDVTAVMSSMRSESPLYASSDSHSLGRRCANTCVCV